MHVHGYGMYRNYKFGMIHIKFSSLIKEGLEGGWDGVVCWLYLQSYNTEQNDKMLTSVKSGWWVQGICYIIFCMIEIVHNF